MKRLRHPAVLGFGMAVLFLWVACLALAVSAMRPGTVSAARTGEPSRLESLGQAGDVFGSVNALFTGVAFVGLIYTVLLQHDQTDSQDKQLLLQQQESSRQAREQYLTARLNARVASLQAKTALQQIPSIAVKGNESPQLKRYLDVTSVRKLGILIDVLSHEAKQGFDGGVWTNAVEKESIRSFLVSAARANVRLWDRFDIAGEQNYATAIADSFRETLEFASELFLDQYPDISLTVNGCVDLLKSHQNDLKPAVDWFRSVDVLFPSGQSPWV